MPQDLGVVVLTHGSGAEARRLVSDLQDQGVTDDAIVVVQNPTDPLTPMLDLGTPGVRVLRMPENRGYAGGMNAGVLDRLGRGSNRILLLTHDVRLREGAVAALMRAADNAPDYAALGPTLLDPCNDRAFSYGVRRVWGGGLEHVRTPPSTTDGISECDS